jgi:hypothetical protein
MARIVALGAGRIFVVCGKDGCFRSSQKALSDSLSIFEEHEETGVVHLETGEVIKVKASDMERFLLENQGRLKSHKRQRRGKPRKENRRDC